MRLTCSALDTVPDMWIMKARGDDPRKLHKLLVIAVKGCSVYQTISLLGTGRGQTAKRAEQFTRAGCDASPGGAVRIGLPRQRVWADGDHATTRPTDRRHVFDGCDLDETLGPGVGCQREGSELRSRVAGHVRTRQGKQWNSH